MRHFSTFSPGFPARSRQKCVLTCRFLRPTLSISTCHSCSSSRLTAFCGRTLTAMALASTNLTPFCSISKVLDTPASTQTNFYTNQLLHKHSFTPNTFCRKPLLHQAAFIHKLAFPHSTFYTNQLLPANHLLHKTPFAPTNFWLVGWLVGWLNDSQQ